MPEARAWLVTGCSSGFGRALARHALERGERVAVTARRAEDIADFAAFKERALLLPLDVTRNDQVQAAVAETQNRFGAIDVLVNNAGYGYLAALEEGEDKAVRDLFEANVFAIIDLTKRVLPGMRARRSGRIVNISSIGGFVAGASSGYYNATKFALEGLSEALAKEVEPLGIRVTLVQPGPFRTDWAGRSLRQTGRPIDDYAATAGARRTLIAGNSGKQAGDPERAAAAIMSVVDSPSPPLRLLLGRTAYDLAQAKLAAMAADMARWESLTLGADFPKP
jgi:NAD(P)-dependent dehydrogenase (short-subunit alcohol dehydrogenase family)